MGLIVRGEVRSSWPVQWKIVGQGRIVFFILTLDRKNRFFDVGDAAFGSR
jgi:hypothetical protein